MLRTTFCLIPLMLFTLALPAQADEPTTLDRALAAEPEYAGTPKYFLLLVGSDSPKPVWCVYDGEALYLDRNADGDLTQAGERLEPDPNLGVDLGGYPADGGNFVVGDLTDAEGETHTNVLVTVRIPRQYPEHGSIDISLDYAGTHAMTASIPHDDRLLAAATAPVRQFGGELSPRLTEDSYTLRLGERPSMVTFWLETAGGGGDGAVLSYRGIPRDLYPVAHVSCPRAGGEPLEWEVQLTERCCENQYFGEVPVPAEAPPGPATLTLSFPDWQELPIAAANYEVMLVDPSEAGGESLEGFELYDLDASGGPAQQAAP